MTTRFPRILLISVALGGLAGCAPGGLDWDMRGATGGGLDTSSAARQATQSRPSPDARGVLSYPEYQVALAQRGDTVTSVANRLGLDPGELARYNALQPGDTLRADEVLALPRRVGEYSGTGGVATGLIVGGPGAPGRVDVTTLASGALDRAASSAPAQTTANATATAAEPARHRVVRGETAYSIARTYNVSARALADWNGLGPEMNVREGQYLLIPVASGVAPPQTERVIAPGIGSPTPVPPSAAKPLPAEKTTPAAAKPAGTPVSPALGNSRTAASAARMAMPVDGRIIRAYAKGRNEGIDIAAAAGSTVKAAADGTVAAITKDTDQVPILVIRHADNLLTVYAGIDGVKVAKGASVKRGQAIAVVRRADPAFLHFEVRKGVDSIDPMSQLQ